ncbi:FKBP-type peptidyl-prolyl cis-trans isomerase [Rhodoflexus caldus]|uniref:FKBP-type peptidyl-prolyl cis-trans isomerase n=1 Tax=Rhodoflexus caldus TaxID=2891236 RepID=UPI00202A892A|nr:FKBP-type peptidyl-prolyl cis-trans isomerase [Rhodoflexus caldus]
MKNMFILLLLSAALVYACRPKEKVRQEMIPPANGTSVLFHERHPEARKPQLKDILWLRYVYIGPYGDTIISTYKVKPKEQYATVEPKDYIEQELLLPPFPGAIEEVLAQVAVGDSLTVYMHQDSVKRRSGYKEPEKGATPFIYPQMPFRYVIKVLGVMSPQEKETYLRLQIDEQIRKQDAVLAQYVKDYSYTKAIRDPSGLYIQVDNPGTGDIPVTGDSISFIYAGHFLNQQFFDSMDKPQGFKLGINRLIPAWEIAFSKYLRKGAKATLFVPSHLAFGHQGKDKIPPFTPLVFRMQVVDIIKAKDLPKYRKSK